MSAILESTPRLKVLPPKTNQSIKMISVRKRLFIGFTIIAAIMLFAIIVMLIRVSIAKNFAEDVVNMELPAFDAYLDLNGQIYQSQAALNAWLLTRSPNFKNDYNVAIANIHRAEAIINDLSKNWQNKENIVQWQKLKSLLVTLQADYKEILNSADSQFITQTFINKISPTLNQILTILDGTVIANGDRFGGLIDYQYQKLHTGNEQIIYDMTLVQIIEYTLLVIVIIASFLIAFYTTRGIASYINIFRKHSSLIASGDLTQELNIENHDELGQLGEDLNVMTRSLANITKKIISSCNNMVLTLDEVKHSVDIQASGASEQASSINEITASVEEIEKSSNQTIEKAKSLGEIAKRTQEKGQMGLNAVAQSTTGMKKVRDKVQMIAQTILELSKQTQQIGDITTVVNTLAQQSKMLALNASIEAAKAGDAGKGFAVVASEVKNLAEQSEQATSQVQKILEDIRHATEKAVMATEEGIKGVDEGVDLVEQTGEIVRNLSDVIHETTIASEQIEAAIRQEGIGIEQINAGMNEINQVTASFVGSVEQTTEAMKDLSIAVNKLKKYMDIYRIE